MNFTMIRKLIGKILILLALLMVLPLIVGLIYLEGFKNIYSFLIPIAASGTLGGLLQLGKTKDKKMGARDGFIIVGLAWILMSLFGCLPFIISGEIKNFFNAFFEITSGFTTTGASILQGPQIELLSHSMLFWRSFSHWIGGMGILVFILAFIPESKEGSTLHILRAESPGPQVGRLVSKMQVTSRILYFIYMIISILEFVILLMLPDKQIGAFESLIYTFGTAGTGGFATTGASIGCYAHCTQYTIAIFMILFGVNFTMYYFLLIRNFKDVFTNEELRGYLLIVVGCTAIITANIYNRCAGFEQAFRESLFTVASLISTTGFSINDYANTWPPLSIALCVCISVFGACAGSTSGGMKITRVISVGKYGGSKIKGMINPRKVETIYMDGKPLEKNVLESVKAFALVYFMVLFICTIVISIYNPSYKAIMGEDLDFVSAFSGSLACISNVGPGLGSVGPAGSYAGFSSFSKVILSFEMIAGRLELFPILILFNPKTWMRRI